MWPRRLQRPSRRQVFIGLMLLSLVLILLPRDILQPLRNFVQLVVLPHIGVRTATTAVADQVKSIGREMVKPEDHADVLREKVAVENELASLRQQLAEAQRTVQELARIRRARLPDTTPLTPARVIGMDAAAGRDSLLVSGSLGGRVRSGDWVASRLFIDAGSEDGVRAAQPVLARECLIGWVEHASQFAARVVLLTDAHANRALQVRIISRDLKQPPLSIGGRPALFPLQGEGPGRMRIPDVPAGLIDSGQVRIGSLVTSDPNQPTLPIALVIGEILELRHNRNKPLFYDAIVRPLCDPAELRQVYVVGAPQS